MPGITLEIAQKHLDAWLEAELACTTNQSYTIGSRTLTLERSSAGATG